MGFRGERKNVFSSPDEDSKRWQVTPSVIQVARICLQPSQANIEMNSEKN